MSDVEYGFLARNFSGHMKSAGALLESVCAGFKPHRIAPHVPPTVKKTRASAFLGDKQIAIEKGKMRYQGAPCKRGHSGIRMRSNGDCVECKLLRDRARATGQQKQGKYA